MQSVLLVLEKHIKLASPSAELHQEILNMNIMQLIPQKIDPYSYDMPLMFPELLQSIKESVSECARSLSDFD